MKLSVGEKAALVLIAFAVVYVGIHLIIALFITRTIN